MLTCGFAGGLRPDLAMGTVVFSADSETGLEPALRAAGAKAARFHCAERVIATAHEKRALRESTGADVVEMESQAIHAVCREQKVPCATVRVILDTAEEDLPLDFNQLMTPQQEVSATKLALALARSPGSSARFCACKNRPSLRLRGSLKSWSGPWRHSLRACLKNGVLCSSRREEAQIPSRMGQSGGNQSLLTSAATVAQQALTFSQLTRRPWWLAAVSAWHARCN